MARFYSIDPGRIHTGNVFETLKNAQLSIHQ